MPCAIVLLPSVGPLANLRASSRDSPFPCRVQGGVERRAQRLQGFLPRFPDGVDLGVVGDGFEGDVGDSRIDEALAHVAGGRGFGGRAAREFGFLLLPFGAVGEQVEGVARPHDPGASEGQGDAGGVDGDPARAPLLGDGGGGAGAAGRVEHEVAGVGGHQEAAFDDLGQRLDDIGFFDSETADSSIEPSRTHREIRSVIKVSHISGGTSYPYDPISLLQSLDAG